MRAWLGLVMVALGGCAYTSEYHAPVDGRPRPVWRNDHVAVERAGAPLDYACMQALAGVSGSERLRLVEGDLKVQPVAPPRRGVPVGVIVAGAFFVPHYWGPPLVAPAPGLPPLLPHPPLLLPPPLLLMPRPAPLALLPPGPLGAGGGAPSLGSDDGRLWAALAVVALVVLPAVAVGLAVTPPEGGAKNAEAIDQVNAYNDWLRSPGSPCSYAAPAGGAG